MPIQDTFQKTLEAFKIRLTSKEREDFQFTTLEDVRQTIAHIQAEQGNQKTMMDLNRLESFLEAMNQFGNVIEVFLNASNFVCFIWGPMKFLLQVTSAWADSFDTILDAYKQIGEQIPLLQQCQTLFDHNPHMQTVLEMIYSDILEFHKRALRTFQGPMWKQLWRSVWKDFQTRFKRLLEGLGRHREIIQSQANLLHFQQYEMDRRTFLEDLNKREEIEQERKYVAVRKWMSGAESSLDHEDACKAWRKYTGTGKWILKNEHVRNWREAQSPTESSLWINGVPGAGKTVLASVIIEDCLKSTAIETTYFYCKHAETEKNTSMAIFRGLLSQLIFQNKLLLPHCYEKTLAKGELTLSSAVTAQNLLELFLDCSSKQYMIIDGLDECSAIERKLVLAFFNGITRKLDSKDQGKFRILFVSQDEADIKNALKSVPCTWISLGPGHVEHDLQIFAEKWSNNIGQKFDLDTKEVNFIAEHTCLRAEGMFLFAKLVLENLFDQISKNELKEEMHPSRFPQGLEQAYQRILARIKNNLGPKKRIIAQKILGWMVCVRRPLKWYEIQAAFSMDLVKQTVDFDGDMLRSDIKELCGSLVQVKAGDRVGLVHHTARYYITSTGYVRKPMAECRLTALCLQYLTFDCFDLETKPERLRSLACQGYLVFQDYAIAYWFYHLGEMVKGAEELLDPISEAQAELRELDVALPEFAGFYEDDIADNDQAEDEIADIDQVEDDIADNDQVEDEISEPFSGRDFYSALKMVMGHVTRHKAKGVEAQNDVSLRKLDSAMKRNRKLLEDLAASKALLTAGEKSALELFYGKKSYKCSKIFCFDFYEGFTDAKSRDMHILRHDRPFRCTFEDCSVAEFGFGTNKELEKHERLFHPTLENQGITFTTPKATESKTPWQCSMCNKRFTRGFHMRNHVRAHMAERPFACSECGKAFTRRNDCKRHEKIHERKR